ncbi:hypothetical protein B0H11DRAFT_1927844 [Mycena galericulata]|nr:hypothetical protein B0H11DRAFT_1927844 [Mycena galericulata]
MAYLPPNSTAIIMPPSASDRPGGFYTYFDPTFSIAKMGCSNDPARHKLECARQCRGEAQIWLPFYWEVPFAAKFERLIHHHYQRVGAWLGPVRCTFCGVNHREKYWFHGYSELIWFIMTVEHYLGVLDLSGGACSYSIVLELVCQRSEWDDGLAANSSKRQGTVRGSEREKRRAETLLAADVKTSPAGIRFGVQLLCDLDRSKNPHVCFWLREGAGAGAPSSVPWEREWDRMRERERGDEAVPEVGKGSPGGTPLAAPAGTP